MNAPAAARSAVHVELTRQVPEPSRTWDAARELGRALAGRDHRIHSVTVTVHANRRELLRWRIAHHTQLAVHWALVGRTTDILAVVDGNEDAWRELVELIPAAPLPSLEPQGRVHHLADLLATEHARLPPGRGEVALGDVRVTWGRFASKAPRRVLRLGSCDGGAPPVLRIHPVLDHETVPHWFVGFVLFHELLHVVIPPLVSGARRVIHPPSFRRAEKAHPDFARSIEWERRNLGALIARCRQHRARRAV